MIPLDSGLILTGAGIRAAIFPRGKPARQRQHAFHKGKAIELPKIDNQIFPARPSSSVASL